MKISNATFHQYGLHVHDVLKGVHLKDVWAIALDGGGDNRTLDDVLVMVEATDPKQINPAVRWLFRLRHWMGKLMRWDTPVSTIPTESFVHRLPQDIADASIDKPGEDRGPVRVLYRLPDQMLGEVINGTVHAFISFSLHPTANGYQALLAVYTIRTKWWTPLYMTMIEPFRRWFVYPGLIKTLQRRWAVSYASAS